MRPGLFTFFLSIALIVGCSKEIVVVTEEQMPNDILYLDTQSEPYNGKCVVYYHKSEQIHYVFNYEEGILNGAYLDYYKNGKIKQTCNYSAGELDGVFTRYDENGKVRSKYLFKKGELSSNF